MLSSDSEFEMYAAIKMARLKDYENIFHPEIVHHSLGLVICYNDFHLFIDDNAAKVSTKSSTGLKDLIVCYQLYTPRRPRAECMRNPSCPPVIIRASIC